MSVERTAWSNLRNASWLCVVINILSGIALIGILRHGLQTNPDLQDRIHFLIQHRTIWLCGWATFTAASLSLLYFFFCFSFVHDLEDQNKYHLLRLAIFLATAGVVLDMAAQVIQMLVLPDLAQRFPINDWNQSSPIVEQFLTMSRLSVGLTGYAANSLYTVAAILACWSTRNFYPPAVMVAGWLVCIIGLALSLVSLMDSTTGLVLCNAALLTSLLFWQGGIAVVANRHRHKHLIL